MVNRSRHGTSLTELLLAFLVLGAVLGPSMLAMRRQLTDTRWANERMMAIQLADDVLRYYQQIGYEGIRNALRNDVPPVLIPMPLDGSPVNQYRVFDSTVGDAPAHIWPPGKSALPNGINPCLGGPGDVQNRVWDQPPDFVSPVLPGTIGSETEATLRQHFRFNRRVEIFGGDVIPTGGNFRPLPGMARAVDCYQVRVTISNPTTMQRVVDQYQVVTVIARH